MRIFALFFFLVFASISIACINGETKELKDGSIISIGKEGTIVPHGHEFLSLNFAEVSNNLDRLYKRTGDLDYLSDYALILMLQKKYKEASEIYLNIEKQSPGRYATASNLGTVYELMGNNEEALMWISKSYRIDSNSHMGSEWLHVKILEAKIKGNEYINSRFLVNTDFGKADTPQTTKSHEDLVKLRDALFYQLNERVSFIKTPEPIVAQLLFDLGNVAWLTGAKSEAKEVFEKAKAYGFSDPLIDTRLAIVSGKPIPKQVLVKSGATRENQGSIGIWIALGAAVLVILFGFIIIRRRKA